MIDLLIGCQSGGKQIPSVFYFKAADKTATSVLSQINPTFIIQRGQYFYISAQHANGLIITMNSKYQVLSRIQSKGDDPCHLQTDHTNRYLVATNYSSGSILICRLQNHIPTSIHSFITHSGSSIVLDRQDSSHPHSSLFSQDNTILFVADLGTDYVYYYLFNEENIEWSQDRSIKIQGAGPRSLVQGKQGSKLMYLSCQLDNTIRVLSYNGPGLEQLTAYKVSQNQNNFLSDVKYISGQVYLALRGDDKIMLFDVKQTKLQQKFSFKVGSFPRQFAVTESGYIFVACQKGNAVQKYQITNQKIFLISQIQLQTPMCIVPL